MTIATSVILCHGVWRLVVSVHVCVCGGQNSWLQSRWHFHSQSISLHSNRGRRQTKERMCAGRSRSFWTKKEPLKYKLWFHVHSRGSPNVSIHSKNHWFILNMLFNGSDSDLFFQITWRMWCQRFVKIWLFWPPQLEDAGSPRLQKEKAMSICQTYQQL